MISECEVYVPEDDVKLFLRSRGSDREVAQEVLERRIYERFYNLRIGDVVVDAGANVGCFTVRACKRVGNDGKVFAIEPSSSNYALLSKSIRANNFESICRTFQLALGSEHKDAANLGIFELEKSDSLLEKRELKSKPIRIETVKVEKLDDIIPSSLSHVDFLKVDVEGSEFKALRGASGILKKFFPKIAMEIHPIAVPEKDLVSYLKVDFGYEVHTFPYEKNLTLLYAGS